MSTQINQYLMYGVQLPFEWHQQWEKENNKPDGFYEHFQSFMDDNAFNEKINHKDGIFCLFDGRDGRYIIIGRVISKTKDGGLLAEDKPITLPEFSDLEKELLRDSVKRNFGVEGDWKCWFVTHFV